MIIDNDFFVWKKLNPNEARAILINGIFEVYEVNKKDGTEHLIEDINDMHKVFELMDNEVCIQVGFIVTKPLYEK